MSKKKKRKSSRLTAKQRKRLTLFAVMFTLALILLARVSGSPSTVMEYSSQSSGNSSSHLPGETDFVQPTAEVVWVYPEGYVDLSDLPNVDIGTWEFTLVNSLDKENYVRDSFIPQLVDIEGYQVRTGVDEPLQQMLTDCRNAGYTVAISRAYMSYYEISYKFNGVASGLADGQGMAYEDAVEKAKTITHYPGTDEHQLGVAVNFVDGEGNYSATSPAMQWLAEHCAEYGFILRYPMGKSAETGWSYTANQFRYVGREAAAYIMDKGICLEEFLTAVRDAAARDF